MQNLSNIDWNAVNGSQPLAVATPERSRLATFHAKEMFCGFCEFCDKKIKINKLCQVTSNS